MMRRRGGPGLIGGLARTALVAGTATAVSGRVARRQQNRWAAEEQEAAETAYAPAEAEQPSYMAELAQLAELRKQGIVTPEEFEAKKKQLLGL